MIRQLALAAIVCCALGVAQDARAGSVCGIVRDASTSTPVPRAGVFLYQSNAYTGLNGATDVSGAYCIVDVPAGTYDLQVRVDDHQSTWVTGIEVTTSPTSVDIDAFLGVRLAAPWPNPASSRISFEFSSADRSPMHLRIFDTRGRLVKGWIGSLDASGRTLDWDFRDQSGRQTAAGVYFAQLQVGQVTITRSFVRIR